MTPRIEAIAFRIWAYAAPRGWDCSASDIADDLGLTPERVGRVVQMKGWSKRMRGLTVAASEWRRRDVFSPVQTEASKTTASVLRQIASEGHL